jgi:glycerophosphoryl diester phosphodiesterase
VIIGHRGASQDAPENTLAAFALALEQKADGFELDVHMSADGVPVIIHDPNLERTTNGRGRVSEHTVQQLKQLDAGDGQRIPTLDDLFAAFGSTTLYNVEIKGSGWRDQGLERAVAAAIVRHDLASRVVVSSFSIWAARRARRLLPPETMVGYLHHVPIGLRLVAPTFIGSQADHPVHSLVTPSYMQWATKRGLRVHTWTVDDPQEAQRLVNLGVHGIITNRPGELRQELS